MPTVTETIHLRPHAGVAERVRLPGDPGRALRLAQVLLASPPQMLNHNRGLWGYTGIAADGEALTVQSTGMGGPSAAIVVEELIALGARRLVRVGTCGALADGLRLGELLIADRVIAADGTSRALGAGERLLPDPALLAGLRRAARGGTRAGTVVSADLFYEPEPGRATEWTAAGAVAVEMEAAAVLAVAARHRVAAACVLVVSDVLTGGRRRRIDADTLTEAERRLGQVGAAALAPTYAPPGPACASAAVGHGSRRVAGLHVLDLQALLLARHRPRTGVEVRGQVRELGDHLGQLALHAGQPLVAAAARAAAELLEAPVEAVDGVLDALKALRDRPQAPGEALDVGGRRQVEGPHGGLLGLGRAFARLEGPGDRPADQRVLQQLLRQLAQRVLALARQPVTQ